MKGLQDDNARLSANDALQRQLDEKTRQLDERSLTPARIVAFLTKRLICAGDMALLETVLKDFVANEPVCHGRVPASVLSVNRVQNFPVEVNANGLLKAESQDQQRRKRQIAVKKPRAANKARETLQPTSPM